jgi:hypothetical protein
MRPSLGYSNYHWINEDRKALKKKQKEIPEPVEDAVEEVVLEPIVEETREPPIENTSLMIIPKEENNADV